MAVDPKTIDWASLGFAYMQTKSYIVYKYSNGAWDEGKLMSDPMMPLHIAATALHYGQAVFEGLKAFRQQDGKVVVFRPEENAKRMQASGQRLVMATPSTELFLEAVDRVVKDNIDYVPPFTSGGSLYIRPLLIGSGAQIGVSPAKEYLFLILVSPVGPYYKGGLKGVRAVVFDEYDRAAPLGVGHTKCAGNYAASLFAHIQASKSGFPVELYLDAKTHTYVEEFSTSNFFGIYIDEKNEDGTPKKVRYVTPSSSSILPSITNKTLRELAEKHFHWTVEARNIPYTELGNFAEMGATGTAVVVTPVNSITRGTEVIQVAEEGSGVGAVTMMLYKAVQDIQYGRAPDTFNWNHEVKM